MAKLGAASAPLKLLIEFEWMVFIALVSVWLIASANLLKLLRPLSGVGFGGVDVAL